MKSLLVLCVSIMLLSSLLASRTVVFAISKTGDHPATIHKIINEAHHCLQEHVVSGERCWDVYGKHECQHYHFSRPSGHGNKPDSKYAPAQWLWDSCSHVISWSHLNTTNAALELETLFKMQDPKTGFVPETIYWAPQTKLQDAENMLFYGETQKNKISQMPVPAYSLRAVWNATRNVTLVQNLLPKVVKYFTWWKTRELSDSGLVSILHGWESGLDASPMYDEAYFVSAHPTFYEMYPHFDTLMAQYNLLYKWNRTEILGRKRAPFNFSFMNDAWFYVEDVGLNSVLAGGWGVLGDLAATVLHDPALAAKCKAEEQTYTDRIVKACWNEKESRFQSRYRKPDGTWALAVANTAQALFPLLLDIPSDIYARVLGDLLDPKKFWTPFPVPSTAVNSPSFVPVFTYDLMWRGPTWAYPNWFVMEGLSRHNEVNVLNEMMDRWVWAANKSGIWEQYNTFNATGYGVHCLGMSCLVVDFLFRLGRV